MAPKKAPASSSSTAAANDDPTSVNPDGMSSSRTTHSREKLKLCEQIVLNHFGPVASQIASLLLQRGRLSLKELERFLVSAVGVHEETNVTKAQILHTLLVLVQHNVLFHIRLNGDGGIIDDIDEPGGTEHFEINPEAILVRARFGTYIEQAQRLWGDEVSMAQQRMNPIDGYTTDISCSFSSPPRACTSPASSSKTAKSKCRIFWLKCPRLLLQLVHSSRKCSSQPISFHRLSSHTSLHTMSASHTPMKHAKSSRAFLAQKISRPLMRPSRIASQGKETRQRASVSETETKEM